MPGNNYQEHLDRFKAAIEFEPVDRVPFIASGSAVNAQLMGVKIADYINDMELCCTTNLEGIRKYAGDTVDGTQCVIFKPNLLSLSWLGKVKIPGEDIGDNELWQMFEQETLTQDDYDLILEEGYRPWLDKVLKERLDDPIGKSMDFMTYMPTAVERFNEAGIPVVNGGSGSSPVEMFCGGRTLVNFFADDLYEIPDKVDRVFRIVQDEKLADLEATFKNPEQKPIGIWIGAWRGTPDLLNPEMFERYSWKYMKEIFDLCMSYDVIPIFHLDSNWDNGIKYFKELPARKGIIALDGMTDIFEARKVIGDHMAIMGDVPAAMQSFSKPEEVDAYCKRLITEVGPQGYIMCSGCDSPFNAKLENLQAMVQSVEKYTPAKIA
ncbi:MAG: uroporphyrinogen decarboxylase family protein [Coriobacteriales bacterium]|jgi:uroporphyrinogen-III decarboxylase